MGGQLEGLSLFSLPVVMVVLVVSGIEFGKNFKIYLFALKKKLSYLAGLAYLHMFIWKIFISPRWDPGSLLI